MPILAIIHNRTHAFVCKQCHHIFTVPWYINFITPHWFSVKLLRCPNCGSWTWARIIRRKSVKKDQTISKECEK